MSHKPVARDCGRDVRPLARARPRRGHRREPSGQPLADESAVNKSVALNLCVSVFARGWAVDELVKGGASPSTLSE
jgi:hypothetical protein